MSERLEESITEGIEIISSNKDSIDANSSKVYTSGQAARISGLSVILITKYFDKGLIKGFNIPGSRHRRIPYISLVKFMN